MTNAVLPITDGVGVIPVVSPTLPPATHTNVWVLGDHHVAVIDPACPAPDEQQRLDGILEMYMVEQIILTHHHVDHIGAAEFLRSTTGARIIAHPLTAERVPFDVDVLIEDGELIGTDAGAWKAIHTPGHASGHLCFYNPGMGLVAGDMVAGIGTILLDPPEGNLGLYLNSLALLRDLQPARLLPAHGPPIEDAVGCLTHYIDHRHQRTEQIIHALTEREGGRPEDLVAAVYQDQIPTSYHPIAARQILCHLEWLETQDRVRCDGGRFTLKGAG